MKNKRFLNNIFSIFVIILVLFGLSGCSPEYLRSSGKAAYGQRDYLYAVGCYKGIISQKPDDMDAYYYLGKSYLEASDPDRAIDNFSKIIESNSSDAAALKVKTYQSLAQAYYQNGEYEKSLDSYKKANAIDPGTDLVNVALYTDIYDVNNQIKAAIDLQKRYNYSPEYLSRQYRILAYLYNRDNNYDEALKRAIKAIEAYPDNEVAYYMAGFASGQKGQYEKAIEAISKATKMKIDDAKEYLPMYISLAYFFSKNGQTDEAIAAYNQAVGSTQGYNNSYSDYSFVAAKALAYYNAGKYDEALFTVNKFIIPLEKGRVGIFLRDSASLRSGYGDKNYYVFDVVKNSPAEKAGLRYGDKIIAINNLSTKGWSVSKLVENLSGMEGTKVAIKIQRNPGFTKHFYKEKLKKEIIEKTLIRECYNSNKQNKDLANIYGIRSLIYRAKGNIKDAVWQAEKAYALYPEALNTKLAYGMSKVDKGDYITALDTLSGINSGMIENARLYNFNFLYFFVPFPSDEEQLKLGKAIAYAKLGRINEAVALIPEDDRISQLPPFNNDYQKLSQVLNQIAKVHEEKAVDFERNGDLKRALSEYTVAIAFNSDENKSEMLKKNIFNLVHQLPGLPPISEDTRKHMIRADVLLAENDLQGCLKEYKNALKLAPYIPKVYYNTAMIYGKLKNYDKAISYMNNYIDLAPESPNVQGAKDEITKWELLMEKSGKTGL